ncbi:excalibur calcium-binding domain-containing protein [Stenotrophomonas sp. 1278]|uniref:excalibur calcium-binding domain-containing protein n=1 Tax=Stenotrophomonas sp. 1278 TaxID=2940566 RepID=UPI0024748565|nr:excalibur calcium-binding domain-containing protein [Stenotrophomonas sp. 1278]
MIALALPVEALAHSGGLDKSGCHTNRTTGDYHCHRGGPVAPRNFDAPRNNFTPGRARRSGAFANCAEARAAGAAPVRRGEPGYGPHLDRDNDGVGCEPYRGRR